jgi:hypothetical protein
MNTLTTQEALLDVSIMNAEVSEASFTDIYIDLSEKGLPIEIITRLEGIWNKTKVIGGHAVQIGKIIVMKIIDFMRNNSGLALGLAIGAAISAIIGMIPFIGHYLQELTQPLVITLSALCGYQFETGNSIFESAMTLAKNFFQLFADIFNTIKEYWENSSS